MFESKTRPLWQFSNFVVEVLPELLVEDPASIPSQAKKVLESLEPGLETQAYEQNRELALLDLKMVESAIIQTAPEGETNPVPPILTKTVDWFCNETDIPALQYHELIEVNPKTDMRTFSRGENRESEIMFYKSHRLVEERLARIIPACEEYLLDPADRSVLLANYESLFDFSVVGQIMANLIQMHKGHFQGFRTYLMQPRPVRGFDGPSGAYSWRMPFLETLVWGKSLPENYVTKIGTNQIYYSQDGREKFAKILPRLNSADCISNHFDDLNANAVVHSCIRFMKPFRKEHYRAADTHLKEEMRDKAPGTSGEEKPGSFLRNRITDMRELYAQYEKAHPWQ